MGKAASEAAPATSSSNQLVLASRSPRRQALLTRLGVPFQVASAQVDESQRPGELPSSLVQRLARAKALAVAPHYPDHPILAADTIVVLDSVVLGKPAGEAQAMAMLRSLHNRAHVVLSAVFALDPADGAQAAELSASLVWMRDYTDREIETYVASGDPMDKAGAYAIQNRDFAPVARIEGCFSGVMGFPLGHVTRVLQAVGVSPPVSALAACRPFAGRCCLEPSP